MHSDALKPSARRRLGRLACAVTAAALLATGCSSGEEDSPEETKATGEQRTVRLLVRDGSLRVDGSPCSGSGGLIYLHRTAPYSVVDDKGQELAAGELPAGKAVKALDKDFGNARRIPTNCEFSVPVAVAESPSYQLVVEGGAPIKLTPQDNPEEGLLLVALVP